MELLLVSLLSFIFFTYFLHKWLTTNPSPRHHRPSPPPSPAKLPIIGNLHQLGLQPHRSLLTLSQRHGPLMLLHFGTVPALIVSSAAAARDIMKTHDLLFSNRPRLSIADKLHYNCTNVAAAPYGDYWRRVKTICVLHLLSNRRVQSFRSVREEEVALLIKNLLQHLPRRPVKLSEVLIGLTNDVICRVALGRKYNNHWGGEEGKKFKELIDEYMKLLGSIINVGDFIPCLRWVNHVNGLDARARKAAMEMDRFIDGVIEEHERKGLREDPKDFVDVLLQLQREDNMAEFRIDRENIKAIILDMFLGGTDTSHTVLEWAMSELLKHPRVMKELHKEVRETFNSQQKDDDRPPLIAEADLEKLHYLKLVIKETLRLHPPFPLLAPRESTQDVKLMGHDIAAGTMVLVNAWALGRDKLTWGNNAEEFWPERFRDSDLDFKGQNFELIPFGSGRRGCPGISFAMVIVELVLANLVRVFDWELPDGAMGEDLDMTESTGIATHRKLPLVAIATPTS